MTIINRIRDFGHSVQKGPISPAFIRITLILPPVRNRRKRSHIIRHNNEKESSSQEIHIVCRFSLKASY